MELIDDINFFITVIFVVCYSYQILYMILPFILKEKVHKETGLHKYAVLISARNEEIVIPKLIESIRGQDYPAELVSIFVVADNCTDATAEKAAAAGAEVWERNDKLFTGKGYALDFLLRKIREKYPGEEFDGYFIFDADNLLSKNYITEMNRVFSDGYRIITSYRNSKNFGTNWISAGYALLFLRESKYLNYPRCCLAQAVPFPEPDFFSVRKYWKKTGAGSSFC